MIKAYHVLGLLVTLLIGCVPATDKEVNLVDIDYTSSEVRNILNLTNSGTVDSLLHYSHSDNELIRYLAASGLKPSESIRAENRLIDLLNDESSVIRTKAATKLGSVKPKNKVSKALTSAFKNKDTLSVDNPMNAAILESIGKTGDAKLLSFIATTKTYRSSDTLLLEGQAKSIYQFGLRGIVTPQGTNRMCELVLDVKNPSLARLYAANYLARAKELDLEDYQFRLANQILKEQDENVKMALVAAMKNAEVNADIASILEDVVVLEGDYCTKINAVKILANHPYNDSLTTELLTNKNTNLKFATANAIGNRTFVSNGGPDILKMARGTTDTLLKAHLYKSYFRYVPYYYTKGRDAARYDIIQLMKTDIPVQTKRKLVDALGYDILSYQTLESVYDTTETNVLKSQIGASLSRIMLNDKFNAVFNTSPRYARRRILAVMDKIMEDGDVGAMYEVAQGYQLDEVKRLVDSTTFITNAAAKLTLPADIETYNALNDALKFLSDSLKLKESKLVAKPINWDLVEGLSDSTKFVVKTSRGVFTIQPELDKAIESVVNFTKLVEQDFYDGKLFHRVVPNFVIQTGCTRGDGYGSPDFTLNGEYDESYFDRAGCVGMASAGPNTESAQWFVTHSPTPHLDRRYTLFGYVTEGMDIVHKIEQGDIILDIIRIN